MVARYLQKSSLLTPSNRRDNFCKYRATMKFQLLSYMKWTLGQGVQHLDSNYSMYYSVKNLLCYYVVCGMSLEQSVYLYRSNKPSYLPILTNLLQNTCKYITKISRIQPIQPLKPLQLISVVYIQLVKLKLYPFQKYSQK